MVLEVKTIVGTFYAVADMGRGKEEGRYKTTQNNCAKKKKVYDHSYFGTYHPLLETERTHLPTQPLQKYIGVQTNDT